MLALVSPEISGFTDEAVTVLEWLAAEVSFALDELDRPEPEPEPEPVPAPLDDDRAASTDRIATRRPTATPTKPTKPTEPKRHRRRRC